MSLDSRLRADLQEIAAVLEPATEDALGSVLARRQSPMRRRAPVLVTVAASILLVAGVLAWWLAERGGEPDVVVDPNPPAGTYEASLSGDLAGGWRLRFGDGTVSVLGPDARALGARVVLGSFDVRGGVLSTDLLADGPCGGTGSYTWMSEGAGLSLAAEDDDCALRVLLLTSTSWGRISAEPLPEGTYQTPPLTIDQLEETALAAGFAAADVDDELDSNYDGVETVTYTLQVRDGTWTEYESLDGRAPGVGWSGPYDVTDRGTIVAGEPPCGPITYDYRFDGDEVVFVVLEDACRENGSDEAPVGELIAQTTIYQTSSFTLLPE